MVGCGKECNQSVFTQSGQGLIEVMIAVSIAAILMAGFSSMSTMLFRNSQAFSEKFGHATFSNLLNAAMADGAVCMYALNPPGGAPRTFDATAVVDGRPQAIAVPRLYASIEEDGSPGPVIAEVGSIPAEISEVMPVKSIKLSIDRAPRGGVTGAPGQTFTGSWLVEFDSRKMVRPLKPVRAAALLTVDTSNPSQARITDCQQSTPGGGALSQGYQIVSNYCPGAGVVVCAARCPAGKVAVGGGGIGWGGILAASMMGVDTPGQALPFRASNEGWVVTSNNVPQLPPQQAGTGVWAICINK